MKSAFGVEHGEISKGVAYGPGGLPRSRKLIALGRGARRATEGAKRVGHKVATTEVSVHSLGRGTGLALGATGRGIGRVGTSLGKHPEATGAAAIGGGAGYGAYKYQQAKAKEPKPRGASKKAVAKPPEGM